MSGEPASSPSVCDIAEDLMHRFGDVMGLATVTNAVLRLHRTYTGPNDELARLAEQELLGQPLTAAARP